MEYAPNGSLLDMIRRDTYIDERRSRRWFKQILNAVEYCHNHGVVHRLNHQLLFTIKIYISSE